MFKAVVVGTSVGGVHALKILLAALPVNFMPAVIIVQHRGESSDYYLVELLQQSTSLLVKEVEDKETLEKGTVYLAPAGYHVLIESDYSLSLSVDDKVNYCRPSIDVLFESAADVFQDCLIGVLLTGANADGAKGIKKIKDLKGLTVIQNPKTAESPYMPQSAINTIKVDHIIDLDKIAPLLVKLTQRKSHGSETSN